MKNGRLNHREIIFYSQNNSAFYTKEEETAFTIYKQIDFYEFCEKDELPKLYQIDLPLLVNELGLNVRVFANEMHKYGFNIVSMKGTLRNSLFLQRTPKKAQCLNAVCDKNLATREPWALMLINPMFALRTCHMPNWGRFC